MQQRRSDFVEFVGELLSVSVCHPVASGSLLHAGMSVCFVDDAVSVHFICMSLIAMPNQSPEPTAVGAVSSAIAVHVASRRWLSFFR